MEIKVLIENVTYKQHLKSQHGLSMLINDNGTKILFDTGQNSDFMCNAIYINETLKDVDYVVISHGHYDHAGGLENFLKINKHAKIILSRTATKEKYSKTTGELRFIGFNMPQNVENEIIYVDDYYKLSDNIDVYGKVSVTNDFEKGDKNLFVKENGEIIPDNYEDEIYLVIKKDDKLNLITGCAHKGIINIINFISKKTGIKTFTSVVGGFHLSKADVWQVSSTLRGLTDVTIENLLANHCTGIDKYAMMKTIFGEKLRYFYTGESISF